MSKEERAIARNHEKLAGPIVQEYLELNYGGGEIDYVKCLKLPDRDTVIPDFSDYASPYVRTAVIVDEKEFFVLVNVKTGKCYDNYNEQLVVDDFKSYAVSTLSIDIPYDFEVNYFLKELDLDGQLNGSDYANYTEYGISSVDDLFENDQYEISVICKYIASDMDFKSVDTKRFFPATEVSDVYISLVNFRSNERYISEDIAGYEYYAFEGNRFFYYLSDVVIANKKKEYDQESDNFIYSDTVNHSYARYNSTSINGIEFAWNDSIYDLDFKVVPAEKEVRTKHYSGEPYYSVDHKVVSVECTSLLEDTDDTYAMNDIDDSIYCYFDKALYGKEIVVSESSNNETRYDVWSLDWKEDDYIYQWLSTYNEKTSFTLGFYERK
jgi:hypothetical protein